MFDHLSDCIELALVEFILILCICRVFQFVCSVCQCALIADTFCLTHQDTKIVILTFLRCLCLLQVLLGDVGPVAKATLHDTLDKSDLLQGAPLAGQKREVQVVIDIVSMVGLMHGIFHGGLAEAKALEAHDKLSFGYLCAALGFCQHGSWGNKATLGTENLDALGDVSFTNRADLRAK